MSEQLWMLLLPREGRKEGRKAGRKEGWKEGHAVWVLRESQKEFEAASGAKS